MPKQSAGILLYRLTNNQLEVFLVHPGGPFFRSKDLGNWSIPKGEFTDDEDPFSAAKREFAEETGQHIAGNGTPLTPIKQKSGKIVQAWAVQGNIDHEKIVSNIFEIEWPPKSGKKTSFPEVDKAAWFDIETARLKINNAQSALLDDLIDLINVL
jgi:predicted NUDIX family NTP pyrophosphohydrolase